MVRHRHILHLLLFSLLISCSVNPHPVQETGALVLRVSPVQALAPVEVHTYVKIYGLIQWCPQELRYHWGDLGSSTVPCSCFDRNFENSFIFKAPGNHLIDVEIVSNGHTAGHASQTVHVGPFD